jgi:heme-degrading monooxygenase HmoA
MIESTMTYDLLPSVNMKTYQEWAKKAVGIVAKQPGMLEFHVNRNVLGSPKVRTTTVFRSLEDWAKFAESDAWHSMEAEMHGFATNMKLEVWGPSPVLPEPVRPSGK